MTPTDRTKLVDKIAELIDIADRDYADDMSTAAATGDRPDLWGREIDVPVELLRSVRDALRAPEADDPPAASADAGVVKALEWRALGHRKDYSDIEASAITGKYWLMRLVGRIVVVHIHIGDGNSWSRETRTDIGEAGADEIDRAKAIAQSHYDAAIRSALSAPIAGAGGAPEAGAGEAVALDHLANVLLMLAELHEDDRCTAYENALAYYNAMRPDQRVLPVEGYSSRLVHTGPLDSASPAQADMRERAERNPYEGFVKIDARLLHSLWCYGNLHPITKVIYEFGSHQECLAAVAAIFQSRALPASGEAAGDPNLQYFAEHGEAFAASVRRTIAPAPVVGMLGLPSLPSREEIIKLVEEQMSDWWNEICADTDCHPLDIKQLGRRRLEFSPNHWTRLVGESVADALLSQRQSTGGEISAVSRRERLPATKVGE